MRQRFTVVPAVYVILRRANEVCLIRRANTGYRDGYYAFPSGHIDGGEPAHIAGIREAREEVGIRIAAKDLTFAFVMHRIAEDKTHERVDFGFIAEQWEGEPHNAEPDKCDDVRWFALDALPETIAPLAKLMLDKVDAGEHYFFENFEMSDPEGT